MELDSKGASGSPGKRNDIRPAARRREPDSSNGWNANTVMDNNIGATSKNHSTGRFGDILKRDLTEACKMSDV